MKIASILGWAHGYYCLKLDKGVDPRNILVPDIVEQFEKDWGVSVRDELPSSMIQSMAVEAQTWPHTMDATIWAREFMERTKGNITQEDMIGWFANAIMAGYDSAFRGEK